MRNLVSFFVIVCSVLSLNTRAENIISINEGVFKTTPITVVPFGWKNTAAQPIEIQKISEVVKDDLQRSGIFFPYSGQMFDRPTQASEILFRDWQLLKQDYLLVASVIPEDGKIKVTYELFDVFKQDKIFKKTAKSSLSNYRAIAHQIADQVFKEITGVKGSFSTRIMYVAVDKKDPQKHMYSLNIADADGHNIRTVFNSSEPIISPAWSPDTARIAYVSFENKRSEVFIQDWKTGTRQKIASFKGLNSAPAWSPDGKKIALVLSLDGNPEIYVINIATKAKERITNHFAIDTEPFWMEDGRSLIFTSDRGGRPQIYQVDIATKKAKRVTFDGVYNAGGRLTPDGERLAVIHVGESGGDYNIAVMNLKTQSRLFPITQSKYNEGLSIAPNGSMLVYATKENGSGVLKIAAIDGRGQVKLNIRADEVREPAWSPQ